MFTVVTLEYLSIEVYQKMSALDKGERWCVSALTAASTLTWRTYSSFGDDRVKSGSACVMGQTRSGGREF